VHPLRNWLIKALPWITGLWVLAQLLSLRLGLLNAFFYDAVHADVQGIDYFSVPKAFLNLVAGRSAYATFDPPAYGPHSTWFFNHPALAAWLGSWLSLFDPMISYGIYTMLSLSMLAACAWLLAQRSGDALTRRLIWLLILGAFPTYWMLFVGNVHALPVLALGMVLGGIFSMTYDRRGENLLFGGLLLSLFSKPFVLLMAPLLLLLKETRKTMARALLLYVAVSLVFEIAPALNPEAIGLRQVAWLAVHPAFVREHMNSYASHLAINALMRDNSIHWFNMIAQSDVAMVHIDIYSLPVFLRVLTGRPAPGWLSKLPLLLTLVLSVPVALLRDRRLRLEAALLLSMAISLTFFLGYSTAWEYQYASVMPVAALLLLAGERGVFYRRARGRLLALAACLWLPSLYILTEGRAITPPVLLVIWLDRVVPVTLLFILMTVELARLLWTERATFRL
jgi:hypothetical protein